MANESYVILDHGRPVMDRNAVVLDVGELDMDPETGDAEIVARLYDQLRYLQALGEPVGGYVLDAKRWLDANTLALAPEAPSDEEDG